MERRVVWLTSGYPHGRGEQFITDELAAWARSGAEVILLPVDARGPARPLPENFTVDDSLSRAWASRARLARSMAQALVDPWFRREVADLARRGQLSRARALRAQRAVAQALIVADVVGSLSRRVGGVDVLYTYWLKALTCGGLRAREQGAVRRVVSRAHGTDLYEEARPATYNPLIRTVGVQLDALYPISEQGSEYVVQRYGFDVDRVRTARLGVVLPPPERIAPPGIGDQVRLVSISSLTPLKRMDLLVDALAELAVLQPQWRISWRHYGDGPLRDQLQQRIDERLRPAGVQHEWCGQLPHDELLAELSQPADLMVNTSSSEGVPVSVMEAAARGIPCVATDVGATREVVLEDSGFLVPADVTATALAQRLSDVLPVARSEERRSAVRELVAQRFDSGRNHADFVADVLRMAQ